MICNHFFMKRYLIVLLTLILISGCTSNDVIKVEESTNGTNIKEISVNACDLSGKLLKQKGRNPFFLIYGRFNDIL